MSGNKNRSKRVKVWVRTRPTARFAHEMIDLQRDGKIINIHSSKDSRRGVVNNQILDWSFRVDGILHNASQDAVYSSVASAVVTRALDGYNGTVLCYGQTGAGKTFTMTGATENFTNRGLIPRALAHVFREIQDRPEYSVAVRISYLEIYNEMMYDLLGTLPEAAGELLPAMTIVEDQQGVYVKGLGAHLVHSEEEALNLLFEGETNRALASHSLNSVSSRSHCVFTLYIESRSRVQSSSKYTVSKLNFVDLAGSERLKKTKSEGRIQQEAMYINKSLTFLEQTVIALADKARDHVPFRQSKLTHFLKDSIGGSCNTVMIANIWGEREQMEETISTLRFANRMMCVAMTPTLNEKDDPVLLIKKLEKEIRALKQELAMHDTLAFEKLKVNRRQVAYEELSEQQRYEISQQVRQYAEGELKSIDIVNVRQIEAVFAAFKDYSSNLEKEIEEKLRQRYTLVDKTDPASIAAAQAAGLPITDDGELVGEPDGSGFGVGPAPSSAGRPTNSAAATARRKEIKKGKSMGRASPSTSVGRSGAEGSSSQTPSGEKRDEQEEAGTPTSAAGDKQPTRPSTPPSRTEAFEEFKQEMGSEINRILQENKEILGAKKKAYADLARQINFTKSEIDSSVSKLSQMRTDREAEGTMTNEEGEMIISENEFLELQRLKDLKTTYRNDFEQLKTLKVQVQYCHNAVDQCRMRLVQEFDNWYSSSFLSEQDKTGTGELQRRTSQMTQLEDEQQQVERLQMALLMENPDSVAFYNAKMRTEQRHIYQEAMRQTTMKKVPGTPTKTVKNRPPTLLQVQ